MLGVSAHGFAKSTKATARIDSFFGATAGGPSSAETGGRGKGATFPAPRPVPSLAPFFPRAGPSDSSASGGGGGSAGRRGETAAFRGDGFRLSEVAVVEAGAGRKRLHVDMTGEGDARAEGAEASLSLGAGGGGGSCGDAGDGVGVGDCLGVGVGVAGDAKREADSVPKEGEVVVVVVSAAGSPQKRRRRPSAHHDDGDDDEVLCWPSVPPSTATTSAALSSTVSATTSAADCGVNDRTVSSVFEAHDQPRAAGRRDGAIANKPKQKKAPLLPPRPTGVIVGMPAGGGGASGSGGREGGEEVSERGRGQFCETRRYQQQEEEDAKGEGGVGGEAWSDHRLSGDGCRGEGQGGASAAAAGGGGRRGQGKGGEAQREAAVVVGPEDSSERDASSSESDRQALFGGGGASGVFGDVDAEVLAALPPEIQREIWMQQVRRGENHALRYTGTK